MTDRLPKLVVGSGRGLSDQRLEFRERHFNGVQIGAVGRQEQEPRADLAQDLGCTGAFVVGQVVEE